MLEIENTPLPDCFLLKPKIFKDLRGAFFESYNKKNFQQVTGLNIDFVQDNNSLSSQGVLRGLHFQTGPFAQAKLVRVIYGKVLDVVVDLRLNSPTFKHYYKVELSSENNWQLFVPAGFAHGFITLSEISVFGYKCDKYYNKASESGIIWNDKALDIDWGFASENVILSEKDAQLPSLEQLEL